MHKKQPSGKPKLNQGGSRVKLWNGITRWLVEIFILIDDF